MWLTKVNEHATNDVTTQQSSKYAHLKNNAKCNFVFNHEKQYATTCNAQNSFFSNANVIIPIWNPEH